MIGISLNSAAIEADLKKLIKVAKDMGASKEFQRAAKKATDKARTETTKALKSEYTLPPNIIRGTLTSRFAGDGAEMQIKSGVHPLIDFKGTKPNTKTKPVFAKVKKNEGEYLPSAFKAEMPNKNKEGNETAGHTGIFQRKGKARLPIKEKFGPSTVGMFHANPHIHEPIIEKAMETLTTEFWRQVDLTHGKTKG